MSLYNTDKPASIKSEDRFQRYEFSKRIASIIATPKIDKSLIIGIYGKWGEGKTSVMNFVQQELPEETVVVNFNPWMFSDEPHLLRSFFSSISKQLGAKEKTIKEKMGGLLSEYGGAIGSLTQFAGFGTEGLEKLGDKLKETSIEEVKKRVDDLIIQSGKNIVVFVDDIDRLDVQEIQYVFKLVKLVGDFPRTAYVLSFDDEMVSAALAPKYGGDNKSAGYNFLEKIIQVPLKIPKASKKALSNYTIGLINDVLKNVSVELSKDEVHDFLEVFNTTFLPVIDNPRLGVRYANTLMFSLPLLKGEVNMSNLIIVEGLKIFYPTLYDFMRSNGDLFLERTDNDYSHFDLQSKKIEMKTEIDSSISIYDSKKQKNIIGMLEQLFPQLKNIYSNSGYGDDWYIIWTNEKKICSKRYFERYFSYSVQEGDIPDNYFDNLLTELETSSIDNLVATLQGAIEQYSAPDLVLKFRMREKELNKVQSENLALVLAQIGSGFPIEQDFNFATTYAQSASLIASLVRNLPDDKQLSLVLKLLPITDSLQYAMEINYWIMYREKKSPGKGIFSESDETKIQETLLILFKDQMSDDNFFTLLSDGNLHRLLGWWSKSSKYNKSLKTFLKKHLKKKNNSQFALNVLKIFTPTITSTSWENNQSVSFKSGFYSPNYEEMKNILDVKLLNNNLIFEYGMHAYDKDPSTVSDHDPIDDQTLVSIFQWFIENDKLS
jgi:predicted KAP-like P-loop ATPase